MEKKKGLFNFLTLGIVTSVVILFIANILNFSLSIDFNLIGKILGLFLLIAFFINLESIKNFFLNLKNVKSFFMLSFLNLLLIFFFVLFYSIFRFGSPLIFEDRIANFKVSQKKEIVLGEPLRQSFTANSNNLGTIGLKIIAKDKDLSASAFEEAFNEDEEIVGQLPKGETDKIIFRIKENKPKIRDLTENLQSSISLFGIPLQKKSQDEGYIFEKERSLNYFYENTYELTKDFQTSYFLFGFPIQKDSKDKSYIFEIEKVEEGETGKTFLLEKNSDGKLNFYPKYGYSLKEISSDSLQIISNISRKINQFLEEKTIQTNLIIVLLLIEFFILSFLKKEDKYFKEKINPYLKYGFLLGLLLITISSLKFEFIEYIIFLKNIVSLLSAYNLPLAFFTIIFGFLVFYFNKEEIEKETEKEKAEEELAEEKRYQEFGNKFPTINKIPLFRNFIRWCYKEGGYGVGLVILVIVSVFILTYQLGYYEFKEDEFQVVDAAVGYYHTGSFYKWDWLQNKSGQYTDCIKEDIHCHYTAAWPHTWLIAQSYKIFGISEWSSRLVSVLFGLIFILLVYFVTKYFTGMKDVSFLSAFAVAFYHSFIDLFRYTRMYAVLIPIFLVLFYLLFRAITEKNKIDFKLKILNEFIKKNLDFNYGLLIAALIFLVFNYLIHINSLIILPVLLFFLVYLAVFRKEKKYVIASLLGIFGCIGIFLMYYFGLTTKFLIFLSFFGRRNYIYSDLLTQYPFPSDFGILLLLLGITSIFIFKGQKRDKIIYSYLTIIITLIFFVWIGNRYAGFTYISHIATVSIILIITAYCLIVKLFKTKYLKFLLYLLLVLMIGFNFYQNFGKIYKNELGYGRFVIAYQTIKENFNPEKDVLFGQYLKPYYLQEMAGNNIKTIDMLYDRRYEYETFLKDISKYESGWIAWQTRKGYHIRGDIKNYINENFKKYHGSGIDDTNVEVYYFNRDMIKN